MLQQAPEQICCACAHMPLQSPIELMLTRKSSSLCDMMTLLQSRRRILGQDGLTLPWEVTPLPPAARRRIGAFKKALQELLNRRAAHRPSMHEFGELCDRLLAASTLEPPPARGTRASEPLAAAPQAAGKLASRVHDSLQRSPVQQTPHPRGAAPPPTSSGSTAAQPVRHTTATLHRPRVKIAIPKIATLAAAVAAAPEHASFMHELSHVQYSQVLES